MNYSIIIINSNNAQDYYEDSADGIRFENLTSEEIEILMRIALKQDFSIIVQKYKEN